MAVTLIEFNKTVTDPMRSGIIQTLYTEETFFQYIPFQPIPGLAYAYNKEQALPGIAFRPINGAYTATAPVVQREVEALKPFGGESDTDVALVKAYGMQKRSERDSLFAKAMAVKYLQFFLYGNSPASRAGVAYDDINGFDGIQARLSAGAQWLDGGGSTGADGSSVFAIRFGEGYCTGLQTPEGVDAQDLGVLQASPAYRTRIEHIAGMCIEHGKSVVCMKDLTAATTVLTCAKMDQIVDACAGKPTVILMSKRSRRQLKADAFGLGVTLALTLDELGKPIPAWDDVPILVSDAVIDTETVS